MDKKILVTCSAGFIVFNILKRFLETENNLICINNLDNYYDFNLKEKRLKFLSRVSLKKSWKFIKIDLETKSQF